MKDYKFQVNLGGMIDILSNHLYSEESVFVREVLQNCVDAISMRQKVEKIEGEICFEVYDDEKTPQICIEDNGVGLTKSEIHDFLANIGASIKRIEGKLNFERADYIGQFGIGLLSCFMVADEIVLITKSIKEDSALKWVGKSDGSYTLEEIDVKKEPGTQVFLRARSKHKLFEVEELTKVVKHYGQFLPIRITVNKNNSINAPICPFESHSSKNSLMELGNEIYGIDFFDAIPLYGFKGENLGVAYILPNRVSINAKHNHRVYLKKMLVSNNAQNVLPDWAVFTCCVFNSTKLQPTASRESFYEDEILEETKSNIGNQIKNYINNLAKQFPKKLEEFIRIHQDNLKLLALENDEFFSLIYDKITFPSSLGEVTVPDFFRQEGVIRYAPSVDEFRQVATIAASNGKHLINAGYTYSSQLLSKLKHLKPELNVIEVEIDDYVQTFDELSLEEYNSNFDFIERCNKALEEFDCSVQIKKFSPDSLPSLFYSNESMQLLNNSKQSKELGGAWEGIMNTFGRELSKNAFSKLVFNYNNGLIRRLSENKDGAMVILSVKMLYVQALMLSHYPISSKEMNIISKGMIQLLEKSNN